MLPEPAGVIEVDDCLGTVVLGEVATVSTVLTSWLVGCTENPELVGLDLAAKATPATRTVDNPNANPAAGNLFMRKSFI